MRFAPVVFSLSIASLTAEVSRGQGAEIWTVTPKPLVEIGVVEGDPNYELFKAISSVRLPDGRIVVLNAGTSQLRIFDAKGTFLSAVGRNGGGPGEFMSPARVYLTSADSLLVFDRTGNKEHYFNVDGTFIRAVPNATGGSETLFPRDVWMLGRNFIDGPPVAAERQRIIDILARLPEPGPTEFRYARVDPWYRLWVREARAARAATQRWSIYGTEGRLHATLETPAGFEIHQFGPDFLLGRERTELDTEVIRLYSLRKPQPESDRNYFTPAAARPFTPPLSKAAPVPDDVLAAMRSYSRMFASQQERYYGSNGKYAMNPSDLTIPEDKALTPHILLADDQGWLLVVVHGQSSTMCAMGMGPTPPGWPAGRAVCSNQQ